MLGNAQMFKQFPLGGCVILNIAAAVALPRLMHFEGIAAANSLSLDFKPTDILTILNSMILLDETASCENETRFLSPDIDSLHALLYAQSTFQVCTESNT